MKRFTHPLLLICLSAGFFSAWLASIADYRTENRIEENKGTTEFSELEYYHRDGERLLEIKNLASTPDVEVGDVFKLEFDDRFFEFCIVTNGARAFTFCREGTGKASSLANVLASASFDGRTNGLTRLSWMIGDRRVDHLLTGHEEINKSEIVILDYQRDSWLMESSAALGGCWLFVCGVLAWRWSKVKPDRHWQSQLTNGQTGDFDNFPAAMALIGKKSELNCHRRLDKKPVPLNDGPRRSRSGAWSLLNLSMVLSANLWTTPIIHSIKEIFHCKTHGLAFFQFSYEILLGSYVGWIFLALILVPMLMAIFQVPIPIIGFEKAIEKTGQRKSKHWKKAYLQFHEALLLDLGFQLVGDYEDDRKELAYFVSSSKRVMVALGVNSDNTGYQIYSVLSNGNLVQTCCWLERSDRWRVEKGLQGAKFVHQESDHDKILEALEAHEILLQDQCSETVLELEFHDINVLRFIRPVDMQLKLKSIPGWKPGLNFDKAKV